MSLSLLDWRRAVLDLYREVRSLPPETGHRIWVAGRRELLRGHPDSPLPVGRRHEADAMTIAAYDPAFRFVAEVEPVEPLHLDVATSTDGVVSFEAIGRVQLPGLGHLHVWWLTSYGGGVFVPVKDGLAGTATYGGGRYLIDTVKGADLGGRGTELVLDLNFAYNPSCAYDPRWTCPLAPETNTLSRPVPVGEMASAPHESLGPPDRPPRRPRG